MGKANRENILIIMAAAGGFPFDGYVAEGYHTVTAYKPVNSLMRIVREICFRLPLLPKTVWYNPAVKQFPAEYLFVRDAIITREYLLWLRKLFPKAQINFSYENMVGKARHLMPDQIPDGVRAWTYDPYDSERYGIRLKTVIPYYLSYVKKKKAPRFDLLFVGRDKNRGDELKKLEAFLRSKGLRTRFLITADGRFSRRKPYYHAPVPYDKITDWVAESRALLNVGMKNQKGVTMRDIESYFNQVRLVTTNRNIADTELYDEKNTFFLEEENWEELAEFLKQDFVVSHEVTWQDHRIEDALREITEAP